MLLLLGAAWFGPATATFVVQLPGDPFDPKRNDVRVRFIGDRKQREERPAWFDPALGAWRAVLFTQEDGRYRAVLLRNGKEMQTESQEGILDPAPSPGPLAPKEGRLFLGDAAWVGLGADLGDAGSPARVDALADAGVSWLRVVPPADPLSEDALARLGATMEAIERRGLFYTVAAPATATDAWRRYALARFGGSPRRVDEPLTTPWDALFERRSGILVVPEKETGRIKALQAAVERSGLADWDAPRAWKGTNAKGMAESDRLILLATPGAKLTGLPLADGSYDLVTLDPNTGGATTGQARVAHAALSLPIPAERFFVLRRRLQ